MTKCTSYSFPVCPEGRKYDPPYDAIPILYYYFAIDSHKIKKTLSETSQGRPEWWINAQQTTKETIKTLVEKISGFNCTSIYNQHGGRNGWKLFEILFPEYS